MKKRALGTMGIVATELYDGQGLGNQLWVYAVTRVSAQRTGQQFAILGSRRFKGRSFLDLDFGVKVRPGVSIPGGPPFVLPKATKTHLSERRQVLREDGMDVSGVDERFLQPPRNVKLDGNMQCVTYVWEDLDLIRQWIKLPEPQKPEIDYCAIHVRLGDFTGQEGPFVGWDYYRRGIQYFQERDPATVFRCVSDDIEKCKQNLPAFVRFDEVEGEDANKARHHLGGPIQNDFQTLVGAKNLLISNSSFSWWAAVLNTRKELVVAPKYWARYNVADGLWSTADIVTPGFHYLSKSGAIETYEDCLKQAVRERILRTRSIVSVSPKGLVARSCQVLTNSLSDLLVRIAKKALQR